MIAVIVILVVLVLVALLLVALFNRLVRARNRVDNAWAQVEVQLKRRWDLIPNLVETVKGYAAHERGTFEAVTQARRPQQNVERARRRRHRRKASSARRSGGSSRSRRRIPNSARRRTSSSSRPS